MSDLYQQELDRVEREVVSNIGDGRDEIVLLAPKGSIGAELGVATGQLSKRFLDLEHLGILHSVDKWDDHGHSEFQHKAVVELLKGYERSKVWRMTAQDWAETIPDESLGFVYIDCYAHTGQDDGTVLSAIWPKVQKGGIFSGDDYDKRIWPLTFRAVNKFAAEHECTINIRATKAAANRNTRHKYPSWWIRK